MQVPFIFNIYHEQNLLIINILCSLYYHSIAVVDLMLDNLRGKAEIFSMLWFKITIQIIHLYLLVSCAGFGSIQRKTAFLCTVAA